MTEGEKEKEFREALQKRLGSAYGRWFANAGVCVDSDSARVSFPQQFSIDYVREHYLTEVQEAGIGIGLNVCFEVNPALAEKFGKGNLEFEVEKSVGQATS